MCFSDYGLMRCAFCVYLLAFACSCSVSNVQSKGETNLDWAKISNETNIFNDASHSVGSSFRAQEYENFLKSIFLPANKFDGITYGEAITILHTQANREIRKHNRNTIAIIVRGASEGEDFVAKKLTVVLESGSVYDVLFALGKAMGLHVSFENGVFFFEGKEFQGN